MSDNKAVPLSSGVEELLQRLREEGVAAGRAEAEKIVADAEARARWIAEQAEEEAARLLARTREEAAHLEKTGREALHTAARDTLLSLKSTLTQRFTGEVKRLVGKGLGKEELLQQLILAVVGQVRPEVDRAAQVEIQLPREAVTWEELSQDPEQLAEGTLARFVQAVAGDGLRDGVSFSVAGERGIRIYLKDQNIMIDLSDEAIADMLIAHLQPRFRALLEGIVR